MSEETKESIVCDKIYGKGAGRMCKTEFLEYTKAKN